MRRWLGLGFFLAGLLAAAFGFARWGATRALGQQVARAQNLTARRAWLSLALRLAAEDPRWWRAWADLGLHQQDWLIVAAAYQGLAQHAPLAPHEYALWARARRALNDPEGARETLRAGLAHYPHASLLWQDLAVLAEEARDWPRALEAWTQAWQQTPDDPQVAYNYARVLTLAQPSEAVEVLRPLAAREAPPWSLAAQTLLAALEPALATQDPVYIHVQVGRALARLGHWPLAEANWTRAVWLDPQRADGWAYLAQAYARRGDISRAEGALFLARRAEPTRVLPALTAGWLYTRIDRPYLALAWYHRAWSLRPDDPVIALALAQTLITTGATVEQARPLLVYITREQPQNLDAWLARARFGVQFQRWDTDAWPALLTILRQQPRHPQALVLLGRLARDQGQTALARRYLTEALRVDPGLAEAHLILAWVLMDQGEWPAAQRHAAAALELSPPQDPIFALAQRTLARLQAGQTDPRRAP
ncbi:MAG: tetratricopeptide repeat protein [Chloroflexi bacterium]|nr:tetratricopeptide repeat protein [Chloroflexota bacterium]